MWPDKCLINSNYLFFMHFENGEVYHIYNRGNNKQTIFFNEDNYLFFLQKVKEELSTDVIFFAGASCPIISISW